MKTLILIAALAITATAQVAAKTDGTPSPKAETPPSLSTAKIWRLALRSQQLHQAANQTKEAKEADAADAEVQKANQELIDQCATAGFTLGMDEKHEDFKCVPKPAPPPDKPKEK